MMWTTQNLPQSVEAARRAFVPGQPTTPGAVREWLSVPRVVALLAAAMMYREWMKPTAVKLEEKRTCDEKYCPPHFQTHVDRPLNTLLKDQSLGAGLSLPLPTASLAIPYAKTKSDYYQEAMASPGVRLVAHAVA